MAKSMILRTLATVAVLSTITVSGVAASWNYATDPVQAVTEYFSVEYFPWEGSDILPTETIGQNHKALIENILNGTMTDSNGNTVGIGLNAPDSELNEQLADRESKNKTTFGSMDAWDSEQMNSLFGLEAAELSFMMYFPDDEPNTKYLYTTGVDLGTSGNIIGWPRPDPTYAIGERIYPIYRTKLVYEVVNQDENGNDVYEWVAKVTVLGSAQSAYYDNDYFGSGIVRNPAFSPSTFAPIYEEDCEDGETAVPVGTSVSNAVYTYVGQTMQELVPSNTTVRYFEVKPESAGTVTITLGEDCSACTLSVYANTALNDRKAQTTGGAASWTATANTSYYIVVSGSTYIEFTIS